MSFAVPPSPRSDDAVLGQGIGQEFQAAILGGLEAVKQNLRSKNASTRIAALRSALNYDQPGLELVLPFLNSPVEELQQTAYELLKERQEPQVRFALQYFSSQGINYTPLRKLLKVGKWAEADQLTRRLMARATQTPVEQMRGQQVRHLPQEDYQLIDRIWCEESKQRFGFSVQRQIWQKACAWRWHRGEAWCVFGERVGWRTPSLLMEGQWKSYEEILAQAHHAPKGCFPHLGPTFGIYTVEVLINFKSE
uniref:GUN4 domain protein n=1 Tax=Cyanothece sp. (strain PCC 7425 / ATCC 29141) TaxID=395961 RepID=B8HXB3_CYAP4